MPRKPEIIEPSPHFSPAFRIGAEYYDHPGAPLWLLGRYHARLMGLPECIQILAEVLADKNVRPALDAAAEQDARFVDKVDSLLEAAYVIAVRELEERNMDRVSRGRRQGSYNKPSGKEAEQARLFYAMPPSEHDDYETLGHEMAAHVGTRWVLNYAAFPGEGHDPLTIRQALTAMAETGQGIPHPELRETYQRWGRAVLDHMLPADVLNDEPE